jgi:hypothetical protein
VVCIKASSNIIFKFSSRKSIAQVSLVFSSPSSENRNREREEKTEYGKNREIGSVNSTKMGKRRKETSCRFC